jgi:hypothetical protein
MAIKLTLAVLTHKRQAAALSRLDSGQLTYQLSETVEIMSRSKNINIR